MKVGISLPVFQSLFSEQGPPDIKEPGLSARVREIAPRLTGNQVPILYAEGPGEHLPASRFVTMLPNVTPQQVVSLVSDRIHEWHEWVPMLAAIEVYIEQDDVPGLLHKVVMTMEGMAAKIVGMSHIAMAQRIHHEDRGDVLQVRWNLEGSPDSVLAVNRGSWTLVPLTQGVAIVYEGHQVPRFVTTQNALLRKVTVASLKRHARDHLTSMVEHLAHRATQEGWHKQRHPKHLDLRFVLKDV